MPWSIPDKGEGLHDHQSILYQEYLDAVVEAFQGLNHVVTGCAVTAQGSPDMTVAVAAGTIVSNRKPLAVASGNVTVGTADGTNPRIDLIVADSAGAKQIRAGAAAVEPKPPARTANDVLLAAVYVPASDTTIATNQIVDLRSIEIPDRWFCRADGTRTFTSNTSAQALFNSPANGRITLPPGLYTFEGLLYFTAMSATSGNLKLDILGAGTATAGAWLWTSYGAEAAAGAVYTALAETMITAASTTSIVTASTATTLPLNVKGTFEVTAAGTLIPSITLVTASAAILAIGSYLIFERIGEATDVSVGPWD